MAHIVRDLPPITVTSSSTPKSSWTGLIDDANCITVYLSSGGALLSSNISIEVSPIDFGDLKTVPTAYSTLSTAAFPAIIMGTSLALSSGAVAFTLTNISFRSFRLATSTLNISSGTIIAYATKQISV